MTNRNRPILFLFMTILERFKRDIEDFLREQGVPASTFGKIAMNDPNFVHQLRKGRAPSVRMLDRAYAYIEKVKKSKQAA